MERAQRQQEQEQEKETAVRDGRCEFTTTLEALIRGLRVLGGVSGRNPALPILANVLLKRERNHLRLSTTDLEVGVTVWLAGKLRGDGALTIPLRSFLEYIQNLPGSPVTLALSQGSLTVTAKSARAVFQGESAENFPLLPHLEDGTNIELAPRAVVSALDAVLYAVATDDTRPELAGVLLQGSGETLTLAATDSYRLAEAHCPLPSAAAAPWALILPGRGAAEIRRALEGAESATLRMGENQVLLLTPDVHVITRRVEGTYPDYAQIIPKKQATTVVAERGALLRAIRASAVFSGNAVSRVSFEVTGDVLRVTATTPEVGTTETELPADVQGDPVTIAFNERFLRDALSTLSTEKISIGLGTSATPAVIHPVTEKGDQAKKPVPETLALIMPIKT